MIVRFLREAVEDAEHAFDWYEAQREGLVGSCLLTALMLRHDVCMPMARTQLSFERETLQRARRRAVEMGISLAEYVRRLVDADLSQGPPSTSAETVFDLGSSDGSDIASDKDRMIAEAIAQGRR